MPSVDTTRLPLNPAATNLLLPYAIHLKSSPPEVSANQFIPSLDTTRLPPDPTATNKHSGSTLTGISSANAPNIFLHADKSII